MLLTAGLLAFTAARMTRQPPPIDPTAPTAAPHAFLVAAIGLAAGLLSGLLGVGGGIVMVPGFAELAGVPLRKTIATSLVCVGCLAIPGTITHALLDEIDWRFAALLTVAVIPGARLGAAATMRANDRRLRLAVAVFLGAIAVVYAIGELIALRRGSTRRALNASTGSRSPLSVMSALSSTQMKRCVAECVCSSIRISPGSRFVAESRCEIHDGAERGVIAAAVEADHADVGEAEGDADAEPEVVALRAPAIEQRFHRLLDFARHRHCLERGIWARQRVVEERHEPVSGEARQRSRRDGGSIGRACRSTRAERSEPVRAATWRRRP